MTGPPGKRERPVPAGGPDEAKQSKESTTEHSATQANLPVSPLGELYVRSGPGSWRHIGASCHRIVCGLHMIDAGVSL